MTGFTLITAAKIQDASGHLLAAGRIYFFPVDINSRPVSAIAGGGGAISSTPVIFLVVNGVITTDLYGNAAQVADCALTTPQIWYRIAIVDSSTGEEVQGPGYMTVSATGTTWTLDAYVPGTASSSLGGTSYVLLTDTGTGQIFKLFISNSQLEVEPA